MMLPHEIVKRGVVIGVLAAVLAAGAFVSYVALYTKTDRILPRVTIGPVAVGGMKMLEARERLLAGGLLPSGQRRVLSAEIHLPQLRWEDRRWPMPLQEMGMSPSVQAALQAATAYGRSGSLWQRSAAFLISLVHGHHVPLHSRWQEQELQQYLERIAQEVNRSPQDARYDFGTAAVIDDVVGVELDIPATLRQARLALAQGREAVDLVIRSIPPAVTRQDLAQSLQYRIARFTTPILVADSGRMQNIAMAVQKISGVMVKPGQDFSFNGVVGPRDAEHGWAQAKELYQGEYVLGYGGGICQVSSTLYNAVLLGGLEVKERSHHDRPLQYVDPGRDATVVWGVLDFRFHNDLESPVMVAARVLPGSPQEIEVALYASEPLPFGPIRLESTDIKYHPPQLEEVVDNTLPVGRREVVDEGDWGIEVKTYRVVESGPRERRELISHDRYRPKAGKVRVGPEGARKAGDSSN